MRGDLAGVPADLRFTELYEEHFPQLVVFFGRRRLDPELSRDLAQETMIRVLKGLAEFRGEVSERSWILKIATNVWYNWLRDHRGTQKRGAEERSLEEHYEHREPPAAGALWQPPAPDPATRLSRAEERARMYAHLDELSALQRRCLLLWLEGRSYREIAATVGTSMQTVRPTLHKAKTRLRRLLAPGSGLREARHPRHGREDR